MAKNSKKTNPALDLAAIVAATVAGNFLYVDPAAAEKYVADGMIEINPSMTENGNVAARATQKGIDSMNTQTNTAPADDAKPTFAIETAPADIFAQKRRGGGRGDTYPFDQLQAPADGAAVGGAFFIPATEKTPEPWKSLASTVSAASRRYARVTGQEEYTTAKGETKARDVLEFDRKFRIVEGEKDGTKGAWVGRVK